MSILKVCRLGHPVLRMESKHLSPKVLASPAIQTLIDNMMETMVEYYGVGLAAPQIHESLSLAVIESHSTRGEIPMTVLVNPALRCLMKNSSKTGRAASVFPISAAAFPATVNCASTPSTVTARKFKLPRRAFSRASFSTNSII